MSTRLKQMENLSVILVWGSYCIIPTHTVLRSRWIRMSVGMTEAFTFTCSEAGIRTQSWVTIACPWRGIVHSVWLKKHLSRDLTLAADKECDLCIILSVNTSHTARLYSITVLKGKWSTAAILWKRNTVMCNTNCIVASQLATDNKANICNCGIRIKMLHYQQLSLFHSLPLNGASHYLKMSPWFTHLLYE